MSERIRLFDTIDDFGSVSLLRITIFLFNLAAFVSFISRVGAETQKKTINKLKINIPVYYQDDNTIY